MSAAEKLTLEKQQPENTPGQPPRELSKGLEINKKWYKEGEAIFGSVFIAIGVLIAAVSIVFGGHGLALSIGALFGVVFPLAGGVLAYFGTKSVRDHIQAYCFGESVKGKITYISEDYH